MGVLVRNMLGGVQTVRLANGWRPCSQLTRVRIPTHVHPAQFMERLEKLFEGRGIRDLRPHLTTLYQGLHMHQHETDTLKKKNKALKFTRGSGKNKSIGSYDEQLALAYSCARMPATLSVTTRIFREMASRMPEWEPRTLLDFGAGTGAALWSAAGTFDSLEEAVAVEQNQSMTNVGQQLWEANDKGMNVSWDRQLSEGNAKSDIVIASYVLGEMKAAQRATAVKRLWANTGKCLVLVEPGSKAGSAVIDDMRAVVLSRANSRARTKLMKGFKHDDPGMISDGEALQGAHSLAPYNFDGRCPIPQESSWSHFGQRLQRTRLMLQLKQCSLPYEDEKFSYTILMKGPRDGNVEASHWARIMSEPMKNKGHVIMDVVTADGEYKRKIVSKADGDRHGYKQARRAVWGDLWPFPFADDVEESGGCEM